jgi:hypothetical protein
MSQTIEVSDKAAEVLVQRAEERGVSVVEVVDELVGVAIRESEETRSERRRAAMKGLLELQKRVKPDPEGWTIRDYIDYGRR